MEILFSCWHLKKKGIAKSLYKKIKGVEGFFRLSSVIKWWITVNIKTIEQIARKYFTELQVHSLSLSLKLYVHTYMRIHLHPHIYTSHRVFTKS